MVSPSGIDPMRSIDGNAWPGGCYVAVAGPHVHVAAPAPRLGRVLAWLAQRELVHYIMPAS